MEGVLSPGTIKHLTRPIITLVGIWLLNKASTFVMLASTARVKWQAITWVSGYLAPEVARTSSRCSYSEGLHWLCVPPGWLPRHASGIRACLSSPWRGTPTNSMTAPASRSCCSVPITPATACLSAGSPWGRRRYCSWSSPHSGPSCHARRTCPPRSWSNLPGTIARYSWPGDHSWTKWSGRPCMGRCPCSLQQDVVHDQIYLSEQGVEQQVHRPHWAFLVRAVVTLEGFDRWPIGFQDLTLQVEIAVAQVQVVLATGRDLELQWAATVRSGLGMGLHQVVINRVYLHALQVQFALGAWHAGLLHTGMKWHPDWSGASENLLLAHLLIRKRCLPGEDACRPTHGWACISVAWLESCVS